MAQHIKVGIDIGTYQIKVAIAETSREGDKRGTRVLGLGVSESKGVRHGYIMSTIDVARSITLAVKQAEKAAGIKVKSAYLSIGGIGLNSITSTGSVVISRADSEITDLDITKVIRACENDIPKSIIANRKIIQSIPLQYRIDGKSVLGRPLNMKGTKLEVRCVFITCLERHIEDILEAVQEAGIEVEDVVAAPFAASLVTLTKLQKMAGCVLANIGAETVSIVVFENSLPISLEVFPIGSTDITNDIALGLKIPLEDAEDIKMGSSSSGATFSKKKLDEIIGARLSDIFELIEGHLKKIERSGLLPAGIILTGGGAGLGNLAEFAKDSLKLPSKVASFPLSGNFKSPIKDATWAVAYGLCILGLSSGETDGSFGRHVAIIPKEGLKKLGGWFKQFLP